MCRLWIVKTWSLSPKLTHGIFTVIVRPILMDGSLVWWTTLSVKGNCNTLDKVQRSIGVGNTGALRINSMDFILDILSISRAKDFAEFMAIRLAIRLHSMDTKIDNCISVFSFDKKINILTF